MDEGAYRVRAHEPTDYEHQARIASELDPSFKATAEEMRRWAEEFFVPPLGFYRVVVAERATGVPVGFGTLNNDPEEFDPAAFWVGINVDRSRQHRGIGLVLAADLEREARERRATKLWASVRSDDVRALRFFHQQGYLERRRAWRSRLDLATAHLPPDRSKELEGAGFRFLTAAELDLRDPESIQKLYELNRETSADEPRVAAYTPVTLEQFVQMELEGPTVIPEAIFLASHDGRLVGWSSLRRSPAEPEMLRQGFTGTLREYRGRGIATELKRRAVEYARGRGFQSLVTGNDSLNQPMLAINSKLGFQVISERIFGERYLEG